MTALVAAPDKPDTSALAAESSDLVVRAKALTVTDAEEYAQAAEFGKGIKALQKKITDFFAPHKRRAKSVHDELCADENKQLSPTKEAEIIVKRKMLDFNVAEAEQRAKERREREAQALKLQEDRRVQEALDLDEDGDRAGAEAVLAEPLPPPIIPLPAPAPKVAGVATVKRWTLDETTLDVAATIKFLAGVPQDKPLAHPEFVHVLCHDTKTARQLITAMKSEFKVPGIRAYEADGMSFGSK